MSTLFNYGSPGNTVGWADRTKHFEEKEIDGDDFKSSVRPRENPRIAVPSPFARFKIIQDAFESVSSSEIKADDRDLMLVSHVLDVLELLFENGLQKNKDQILSIKPVRINSITGELINYGLDESNDGVYLLGRTLEDYAAREKFGFNENQMLFAICSVDKPLAITSPTSVILPSPNYKDSEWNNVLINGFRPIFSERRNLISRNEEFVLYLYAWYDNLVRVNGGREPQALKSFGTYLNTQKDSASRDLKQKISNSSTLSQYVPIFTPEKFKVEIWNMPLYSISEVKQGNLIEDNSDLILMGSVGREHPLILTTNNLYTDMVYTSGQTMWDRNNPGFTYNGSEGTDYRNIPIRDRKTLPNGQTYSYGFIYEHDFLADTLIQLPYRLNGVKFFDGNVEGLISEEIGLIPPIKEEYFNYFTLDDLRENLTMKVTQENVSDIEKVEVLLKLPTTKGRHIVFKKVYYMAESLKTAIEEVPSAENFASGLIARCGVAVNVLPFIRAFADNNYYAFQLLVESRDLDGYEVRLAPCSFDIRKDEEGHELTKSLSKYVRRTEMGVPVVTSYSLDEDNFDYMKLNFVSKDYLKRAEVLLIPKNDIPYYKPEKEYKLQFCFDFGTSNTFVAVWDPQAKLFLDFKLPTDYGLMVSTISDNPTNTDDPTIKSFIAYGKQDFLPQISDRLPFPIPTVMSASRAQDESYVFSSKKDEEKTQENPFLMGAIPFLYGSEDYGSKDNRIISDLKWTYGNKKGNKDRNYTASFINELLFLAQVFAMSKNADLSKCDIYWTYPLSMTEKVIKPLKKLWMQGFNRFFLGQNEEEFDEEGVAKSVSAFPESMAPMLYYTTDKKYGIKSNDTTVSVDIGGGTCDMVVIPGNLGRLKLGSFHFGAECIFGIETAAENIPMFKNAINSISKTIKSKVVKSNPNQKEFEVKAKELLGLKEEGRYAREMSTYLFNLPNAPLFKGMAKQVDFNQWIIEHPAFHTVFLYYYAALVYYIAEMWKTLMDADKPSRILFSGSGSKMFNIICGGDMDLLGAYTTHLFNIFAEDELEGEDIEEEIRVRMEVKEPKQITAKGVLIPPSVKMAEIKSKMQSWKSAAKDGKDYMLDFDMVSKKGKQLNYGDLEEDNLIDTLYEHIDHFHTGLIQFIKSHSEDFDENLEADMERMFTQKCKTERKWRKTIRNVLSEVLENTTESMDAPYPDVPFFEVISSFIKDAMIPED